MDQFAAHSKRSSFALASFGFVDVKTSEAYKWLAWVVERNHPLSEVDNKLTRDIAKIGSVTSKALKSYAKTAEANLRNVIREQLQTPFGLIFDGWTCNAIHFCAIYAVYVVDGVCKQPLLAISKMGDGQTASAHVEKFDEVLQLYDRSNDDIRFLVGDNCSTNQAIANLLKIPFVGCASHRLNLAVNKLLEETKHVINKVQELMVALQKPNTKAHLERITPLHAQIANSTRWSSVYMMLKRYLELRDAARQIVTVEDMILRPSEHRKVVSIVEQLADIDSVCIALQSETRTLADARILFDALMKTFPSFERYIGKDAPIR
ncbi:hypothetical protein ATCC90586_002136 [Pythium insidiosum]|nr:hypothetical protein ATCC90586_002136 [Pythium insidiosum]